MSMETTVKKRTKSKRVAGDDEVASADSSTFVQATAKKPRTRKAAGKAIEDATTGEVSEESPKAKKPREVKKKEASKSTSTVSTSKRAAKSSGNELQHQDSSDNASQILTQATAFADGRREATNEARKRVVQLEGVEEGSQPKEERLDPMAPATQSGKPNKANTETPEQLVSEAGSTEVASHLPTKPSSFLSSFLNNPEPAPVHPPQAQQDRTQPPEESRADLKQATKHDFEDSILSPRGTVKAQPQSTSRPASIPSAVAALMESSNTALSSARLRAFTTSSFAALKAGSKNKTTTSNATASTTASPAPSAVTPSPPRVASEHRKPPPTPSSTSTTAPPPPSKATPLPRAYPSGSLPQSPPRRPPPTPPPRPTDLSYDQLQKNSQYKSLRRKWTAVMVSIPFLVYSSYELWRRWERGDFGRGKMERGKMERDRRVGIEEELRGFDRATAAGSDRRAEIAGSGSKTIGDTVKGLGRSAPAEEMNGQLLDEIPLQTSGVVIEEAKGMEAVSGRQQGTGAAKDIGAGAEEVSVLGRLPGHEMDAGSTEAREFLREGGSKRGWVQVFR